MRLREMLGCKDLMSELVTVLAVVVLFLVNPIVLLDNVGFWCGFAFLVFEIVASAVALTVIGNRMKED